VWTYVISDANKPWVMLFQSPRLDAVADAIAAQSPGIGLDIYASLDGHTRPLDAIERIGVYERLVEARPGDATAQAKLIAAKREMAERAHL